MAETNGQAPWWVKAVQVIGVQAVAFLVLLWWMLTTLDGNLKGLSTQMETILRLQQQTCVNTASTPEQRNACWNPWR